MPYFIKCEGCGASSLIDCSCALIGHPVESTRVHHDQCQMSNIGAAVTCIPGKGCCEQQHDHDAAANACPGNHGPCSDPAACPLWVSVKNHYTAMKAAFEDEYGPLGSVNPESLPDQALGHAIHLLAVPPDECPGGHCMKGVDGCTVCRPVTIRATGTAAVLVAAGG